MGAFSNGLRSRGVAPSKNNYLGIEKSNIYSIDKTSFFKHGDYESRLRSQSRIRVVEATVCNILIV